MDHRTPEPDEMERGNRQVGRIAAEAVVITASILLALGVDAWWAGVQDRQAEQAALSALRLEFLDSRTELFRARDIHVDRCGATAEMRVLLGRAPSELDGDSLADIMHRMSFVTTVNAPMGALNSLITSGDLSLILNVGLRSALAGWPERLADHRESEDFIFVVVRDQWRPWLIENALIAPSWARTPSPSDSMFDASPLTTLPTNTQFANMVTAYDSDCEFVMADSETLERDIGDILERIAQDQR